MYRLLAAFELSVRPAEDNKETVTSPVDVVSQVLKVLPTHEVEHFFVLQLDTKNRIIKTEIISQGILDASIVHPREVFKSAIRNNTSSIVLAHNHPSGIPAPSSQDIEMTKKLINAGKLLDIEVMDHVIIGSRHNFISMKEKRYI